VKNILPVIIFASLISNAWGQTSRPTTLADLAKYAGADRERILYEGAKKETKIVWYTSIVASKEIAKFFVAKYPGIAIDVYHSSGLDLIPRILGEATAKRNIFDVIEATPGALMTLRDNQIFIPYSSPYHKSYPDTAKEKASGNLVYWTTDRESYIGVAYNTNSIRRGDVPKNFDDLLKPALKGKMRDSASEGTARQIGAMIQAKGEAFVRKLKDQEVGLHGTSAPLINELIISGEVPISFAGFSTLVRPPAAKGAPIAWAPMDLVVANAGGLAVSAQAQHPHAALLMVDFLISPEWQKVQSEKFPYGSGAKEYGFKKFYPEKGLSSEAYADKVDKWMQLLKEISRK
jgi:iron(III) transport system substrate-binding protein